MDVSVSGVAPSSYEVAGKVMSFYKALKTAMADGWQPSQDIPAMLAEALKDLAPIVQKWPEVVAEASADKEGVAKAVALAAFDLISAAMAK